MLPTDPNTKLSIYVAERLEKAPDEMITEWYHTFLILVDETTWPVKVIQQLHFDADSNNSYSLMPIALEGTSDPIQFPNRFDGVLVYPVIGGRLHDTLDMWNNALAYSFYLKHMNIPFDRNEISYKIGEASVNCRAGVCAVLDAIGVDRARGYYASGAGTKCNDIPLSREFTSTNESVFDRNDRLIRSLGAKNYKERYVGPLKGTLHVISPTRTFDAT